jgi:putative transposase
VSRSLGQAIWQSSFHDRALRSEAELKPAARYVIANPVRAGLVASVRDYPFWNAAWL